MKLKVLSFYNRTILFFLSVFGLLPACDDGPIIPGALEYGTPWARYKISGKVMDKQSHQGIENIAVLAMRKEYYNDTVSYLNPISDTIKTNKEGEFMSELKVNPVSDSVHLKFFDVNNPVTYQAKDTAIWFDVDNLQGGEGWYAGEASEQTNTYLEEY